MFKEGQLYSPVTTHDDGSVEVHLGDDHPGVTDPEYRARRNAIASAAASWAPGQPLPRIDYTDAEHEIWRRVDAELAPKHVRSAHSEFLSGKDALQLPRERVPQLDQVTDWLRPLTGWSYLAAPGLVGLRDFYSDLGRGFFNSTQYLRHPSEPLYTPEPDVIHEVMGHANQLASPRFARIVEAAGRASSRLSAKGSMKFLASVFWYSIEFGVAREAGEVKAYGAGILSSFGELDEYRGAEFRPLDIAAMGTLPYDITRYQPVLFCAESLDELDAVVGGFFDTVDDDAIARHRASVSS